MTVEDRYLLDIADLATVRMECGRCGAAVSVKVSDFIQPPASCPGCSVRLLGQHELREFVDAMRTLRLMAEQATDERTHLRVRFEVPKPLT